MSFLRSVVLTKHFSGIFFDVFNYWFSWYIYQFNILQALVSSLEKKIDETENKYEETNKLSEEQLKQALEAETKIIQLKTDMQRLQPLIYYGWDAILLYLVRLQWGLEQKDFYRYPRLTCDWLFCLNCCHVMSGWKKSYLTWKRWTKFCGIKLWRTHLLPKCQII